MGAVDDQMPAHQFAKKAALWEPHICAFAAMSDPEDFASTGIKGPLSGLTVGVKDIIDVAGFATRNGSDACTDVAPSLHDAAVVAALRAAGAQIVGKTTTTEFAFTDPTACRNPFDLNRTPGGSSSGSGAAVAAGMVDIALGTQTAGSLCRPAAYCGAVGFKPSYGALPNTGVTPLARSFDSVGIIAGSVLLAQKAFAAIGPPNIEATKAAKAKLQWGLWADDVAPGEDMLSALQEAARASETFSRSTHKATIQADVEQIVAAHRTVMNYEAAMAHGVMLSDARHDLLKPKFRAALKAGALISAEEAAESGSFLAATKTKFWASLDGVDAVLTLPVPDGAPLIDGTTGFQDWLTPWTAFDGPLICLPWGLDRLGRPRSVMLAGKPEQDMNLLLIASKLEAQGPRRPLPQAPRS